MPAFRHVIRYNKESLIFAGFDNAAVQRREKISHQKLKQICIGWEAAEKSMHQNCAAGSALMRAKDLHVLPAQGFGYLVFARQFHFDTGMCYFMPRIALLSRGLAPS
jgi:hypothetical protein